MLASLAAILLVTSQADPEATSPRTPGIDRSAAIPVPLSQLSHTTWSVKDGAPVDISALAQTPDGYLWIGTSWGLYRFDGIRFVPLKEVPYGDTTYSVGGIHSLHVSRDGALWIIWGGGWLVTRLFEGHPENFTPETGLPTTYKIAESRAGELIAATSSGLYQFQDGKWTNVTLRWKYPEQEAQDVWYDRDDGLWVIAQNRIWYRSKSAEAFQRAGQLQTAPGSAPLAEALDGTVWIAEFGRSVHTLARPGESTPFTEVRVGSQTILVDRKGSLWMGSAGDGIRRAMNPERIRARSIRQFGEEVEHYTEAQGLMTSVVTALLEDREGNIWVGSARGLERFRETPFVPVLTPGGVRGRILFPAMDSSLWVRTHNKGFYRISHGVTTAMDRSWLTDTWAQDRSGAIWTTYYNQLARYQSGRLEVIRTRPHLRRVVGVAPDTAGTVWVYDTEAGLHRLQGDSVVLVTRPAQSGQQTGLLFVDRTGRIWLSEYGGVVLYDRGQVERFNRSNGFYDWAQAFFEDRRGGIWIAGFQGISRYDQGRLQSSPVGQSLPGKAVFGIVEDSVGAWWIVARSHVLRLPPGEMERGWADSGYRLRYQTFDQLDGLPGNFTRSVGPILAKAADGHIWVTTDSGVASLDPSHLPSLAPPPVVVEALRSDGHSESLTNGPRLPARPANIEIDYTSIGLATPERARFRYRLDGADRDWQYVKNRRRAYYSELGPGHYRFRVAASYDGEQWSRDEAVLEFRILPAWYQTFLARSAMVILIGGLGAGIAVLLQRHRHRQAQGALRHRYEATLTERTRLAQELHDSLLQGFAGVTLQLKAVERDMIGNPGAAMQTVLLVQRLAQESIREARAKVWDMHGTSLAGKDLSTALEEMARERAVGTAIVVSVTTTGERGRLSAALEEAAFRIGREAVSNAVMHADPQRIDLVVSFEADSLTLEVRDDGRGFSTEEGEEARRRGHFGLSGMRDRAAQLGGHCNIGPRADGGTMVRLELPLRRPAAG